MHKHSCGEEEKGDKDKRKLITEKERRGETEQDQNGAQIAKRAVETKGSTTPICALGKRVH